MPRITRESRLGPADPRWGNQESGRFRGRSLSSTAAVTPPRHTRGHGEHHLPRARHPRPSGAGTTDPPTRVVGADPLPTRCRHSAPWPAPRRRDAGPPRSAPCRPRGQHHDGPPACEPDRCRAAVGPTRPGRLKGPAHPPASTGPVPGPRCRRVGDGCRASVRRRQWFGASARTASACLTSGSSGRIASELVVTP